MSQPLVFISKHRVREGQLDGLKKSFDENIPVLETDKPGTVLFYAYLDEAGRELTIVHVFPDSEAMDAHFTGAAERAEESLKFLEPMSFQVFGTPTEKALGMLHQVAETGVEITVIPKAVGGFIRLPD